MMSRGFRSLGLVLLLVILYFYSTGVFDSAQNTAVVDTKTKKALKGKITAESGVYSTVGHFEEHGVGAYLFVELGAYRVSPSNFSVVGLSSKPIHVFGKPQFKCIWNPSSDSRTEVVEIMAEKFLPDWGGKTYTWGYGRTYTVVVLKCKFKQEVGSDAKGGTLSIEASVCQGVGKTLMPVTFLALEEEAGSFRRESFEPPFPYDYLYCGSPVYGNISAQRVREWIAYHAQFFGPRSHFVLHDTGGIDADVRRVLEPWIKLGTVTIQDLREESLYDGYLHNQFLIANDCLLRHKFMANWTFFFDLDEYMYIPPNKTLDMVLQDFKNYSQVLISQAEMSTHMCIEEDDKNNYSRQWGFEKLVFKNIKTRVRRDIKYAIRAWKADTTGIHLSKDITGKTARSLRTAIQYYHYHGTIDKKGELCSQFYRLKKNGTNMWSINNSFYAYDDSMRILGGFVKDYEIQQIGLHY